MLTDTGTLQVRSVYLQDNSGKFKQTGNQEMRLIIATEWSEGHVPYMVFLLLYDFLMIHTK